MRSWSCRYWHCRRYWHAGAAAARADDYVLTIKDHRFTPAEIKVPANQARDDHGRQ